jgi:hypothetical protein
MKYGIIELHDLYDFNTLDAHREVVMCKECKYCVSGQCWNAVGLDKLDGNVADDDFCSRGEGANDELPNL